MLFSSARFSALLLAVAGASNSQYHDWKKAYAEADRLLATLTLSEKLSVGSPSFFGAKKAGLPAGLTARDGKVKIILRRQSDILIK